MTETSLTTPPPVCASCGAQLDESAVECPRCGLVRRAPTVCPLCDAVAYVEQHPVLRYRCLACGGPRVPVADPSRVPPAQEAAELRRAWRQHRGAGLWRLAATLATVAGLIAITLGGGIAALWSPPVAVSVTIVAIASLPLLLALWCRARTRRAIASAQTALDVAWLSAARSVLAGRAEDLSMQELGRVLGANRPDSERWLAALGASELVATRVDDSGEILYRLQAPATADAEPATDHESVLSASPGTERKRSSQ
ncbi:MAG: hypothetical protein JW940_28570 [Polyangiaceae bacterium]|nr:hypothetical protein [Polyangiaceae bacterium]